MSANVRELQVFMASPGDLEAERESLRHLERRINATFRDRGVRVSISGWEEVQPEAGRPQALINPLVYECDIFLGLLNMRWGSATGTHSSGFEEEFEIALSRRSGGDRPIIGMFFRVIDSERLLDKGPQLTAVLKFQDRVRQERMALYKTFRNPDDLALEIFDFLTPYVLRAIEEMGQDGADKGSTSARAGSTHLGPADIRGSEATDVDTSSELHLSHEDHELDAAQRQIVDALDRLAGVFGEGQPLDEESRDRVTLVGTAFAENPGLLNNHHINRLYSRRSLLELTLGEARAWCRTYFANFGATDLRGRAVPIWGVVDIRQNPSKVLRELDELLLDDDPSILRGLLRFLTVQRIRLSGLWRVGDDSLAPIKAAAIPSAQVLAVWTHLSSRLEGVVLENYVVELASVEDVPVLKLVAANGDLTDTVRSALEAYAQALEGDLSRCEDLAPSKYSTADCDAIVRFLIARMPELTADQWNTLLADTHESISVAAAVELIGHEPVDAQQLQAALQLENDLVTDAIVQRAMRDRDWGLAKIQALNEMRDVDSADLTSRISAVSYAPAALELLDTDEQFDVSFWIARTIQDPEKFKTAARDVLDGTATFLDEKTAPFEQAHPRIVRYLAGRARAAACEVLGSVAEIDDRDVVRVADELRRDDFISRDAAMSTLTRLVTRLTAAGSLVADLGDLSVLDSYRFTFDPESLLGTALAERAVSIWRQSEIEALQVAAKGWELRQPESTDSALEEALYLNHDALRMLALGQLLDRWSYAEVEALLARYDKQKRPYWYNVIATLDEYLYGYTPIVESATGKAATARPLPVTALEAIASSQR